MPNHETTKKLWRPDIKYFIFGKMVYFHCNSIVTGSVRGTCSNCCDITCSPKCNQYPWKVCIRISYILSFFYRKSSSAIETYDGVTLRFTSVGNIKTCFITLNNCKVSNTNKPFEYSFDFYNSFLNNKSMIATPVKLRFTMWGDLFCPDKANIKIQSSNLSRGLEYTSEKINISEINKNNYQTTINDCYDHNDKYYGWRYSQRTGKGYSQRTGKGYSQRTGKGYSQHIGKGYSQHIGKGYSQHIGKGYSQHIGKELYDR